MTNEAIDVEATEGPPIFIVGNGRTGTTLLRLMLSAHPRIYICHELWFYVWESLFPRKGSGMDFFDAWAQTANFRSMQMPADTVRDSLPSDLPRSQSFAAFREAMWTKAASVGKPRFGEKTPGHIFYLKKLFKDFPDARVIVMVRDPRATVASVGEMFWGAQNDLTNCLVYEHARRQARRFNDRVLFVRLEDLRARPREEMQRVLAFVGEDWDDAVLDHPSHRDDPEDMQSVYFLEPAARALFSAESRLPALAPERSRLIEALCAKSMKDFGYDPAPGDQSPGRLHTMLRAATQIPESLRYSAAFMKMVPRLKKPEGWGSLMEATGGRLRGLNPGFWRENPDFVLPAAPDPDASGEWAA